MRIKIFTIPVFGDEAAAIDLDKFVASHRIISIDRQFINDGTNSTWSIFVSYIDSGERSMSVKRGKIDYKEKLNDNDFIVYSQLRDLRKQVAEQEGVPVYALFTNEQFTAHSNASAWRREQLIRQPLAKQLMEV